MLQNDRHLGEYILSILGPVGDTEMLAGKDPVHGQTTAEQIKQITDRMSSGFFIYRAAGDEELLYANDAMLRIFNCETMEEFRKHTGNSFQGIVHPDDIDMVEQSIYRQIIKNKRDLDYVRYRIIQKGGAIRWLEDYGHFVHDQQLGDVFCVFVSDITDRDDKDDVGNLQHQLQEYYEELEGLSQEHLRRLEVIEGLSVDYESIFYIDLERDVIRAYRASYRIGDKFAESPSRRFSGFADEYLEKFVHPEDKAVLSKLLDPSYIRSQLESNSLMNVTYRIFEGDSVEYMQIQIVHVRRSSGASMVVMGVRNVNEETRAGLVQREALEIALRQAKSAVAARNAFLTNMSHDMRTPMNAVIGFTALARKYMGDTKKLKSYLDMIESSGMQMLGLINDVLELSRIEARKNSLEESACNLREIAEEVYKDVLPRAEAKGISLTLDFSGITDALVFSDRDKIKNIVGHLVGNAIKFTDDEGVISVSISQGEEDRNGYSEYRIVVTDNGVGISESFMHKMFEPFERERNTTQSGRPGTGLGLTIVKNLVDVLGGTITVDSTVGEGSCFTVTLELKMLEDTKQNTYGSNQEEQAQFVGQKVLVVEDNELNMEITCEILQDAGIITDSAENGAVAVEKVKRSAAGEYALILMDIQMPVMDGNAAAKAIRALEDDAHSKIPIIAVSANAFDEDKQKSRESGMNAHVAKPINISELLELIGKYMKH